MKNLVTENKDINKSVSLRLNKSLLEEINKITEVFSISLTDFIRNAVEKEVKEIKKDLSIDTPLIAYDKYMSYIVYQSYNVKYDDKNTEKIINNVIDEALKARETSRGGTN